MGATYDKPGPLNFRYRLWQYILGRNALQVLSNATNTKDNSEEENLINLSAVFTAETDEIIDAAELKELEAEFSVDLSLFRIDLPFSLALEEQP